MVHVLGGAYVQDRFQYRPYIYHYILTASELSVAVKGSNLLRTSGTRARYWTTILPRTETTMYNGVDKPASMGSVRTYDHVRSYTGSQPIWLWIASIFFRKYMTVRCKLPFQMDFNATLSQISKQKWNTILAHKTYLHILIIDGINSFEIYLGCYLNVPN